MIDIMSQPELATGLKSNAKGRDGTERDGWGWGPREWNGKGLKFSHVASSSFTLLPSFI